MFAVGCAFGVGVLACSGASGGGELTAPAESSDGTAAAGAEAASAPPAVGSFQLSGGGISATFGSSNGVPYLTYSDAQWSHTYTGAEINYAATPAGTFVTVTTRFTIDSGSTSFSVLVPRYHPYADGAGVSAVTQGITTVHRFSVRPQAGQLDEYAFTELKGTLGSIDSTAAGTR